MSAAVFHRYGNPDQIAVEEVAVPTPDQGEVLVKVERSSLNALDWHFLTGTPYILRIIGGLRKPKRTVPGADFAGVVVGLGSGVTDVEIGDAVFGECQGGGCAEFLSVATHRFVPKPDGVSFEAAGATAVAGLTALQGLRTKANVQPGDDVLINGAAGGVGTFSVQIAKALGATVTAVCSTSKVEMVRALGADHVIDYTAEDFVPGGARFDVMIDNVGNRAIVDCLSVLRPDANYVAISGPKENLWFGPIPHVLRTALAFKRRSQTFHQFTAEPNHEDLTYLGELLETGQVVPEIDRTIGLDQVADGLVEIGGAHTRSKIVVAP